MLIMNMKPIVFLTVITTLLFAFKPARREDILKVDTNKSSIEWIAGKIGGEHSGIVKLSSGSLAFDGDALKAGSFVINMKSLAVTDIKGNSAQSLLNHLRGEDFFSVEKHPTSTFTVTKIAPASNNKLNITGTLTIKGVSNSISFPAELKKQKNAVIATAKDVKVDRTKYDIKYRSKSFFGDIGDKAIDDEFRLNINLVAKK